MRLVRELEASLRQMRDRSEFRVTHYSIQRDHVHRLVEAEDAAALSRGMKGVAARLARAVNRVFGRKGPTPARLGAGSEGWAERLEPASDRPAVASARTWLLRTGWRRHGLICPDEIPRGGRARQA